MDRLQKIRVMGNPLNRVPKEIIDVRSLLVAVFGLSCLDLVRQRRDQVTPDLHNLSPYLVLVCAFSRNGVLVG